MDYDITASALMGTRKRKHVDDLCDGCDSDSCDAADEITPPAILRTYGFSSPKLNKKLEEAKAKQDKLYKFSYPSLPQHDRVEILSELMMYCDIQKIRLGSCSEWLKSFLRTANYGLAAMNKKFGSWHRHLNLRHLGGIVARFLWPKTNFIFNHMKIGDTKYTIISCGWCHCYPGSKDKICHWSYGVDSNRQDDLTTKMRVPCEAFIIFPWQKGADEILNGLKVARFVNLPLSKYRVRICHITGPETDMNLLTAQMKNIIWAHAGIHDFNQWPAPLHHYTEEECLFAMTS